MLLHCIQLIHHCIQLIHGVKSELKKETNRSLIKTANRAEKTTFWHKQFVTTRMVEHFFIFVHDIFTIYFQFFHHCGK
jgi:hypothetical protein